MITMIFNCDYGDYLKDDLCFATFFAGHVDKRRIPAIINCQNNAVITPIFLKDPGAGKLVGDR